MKNHIKMHYYFITKLGINDFILKRQILAWIYLFLPDIDATLRCPKCPNIAMLGKKPNIAHPHPGAKEL